MSNHLHHRSASQPSSVSGTHAKLSTARARAREIKSKDPVAAQAMLDIAEAIRESARTRSNVDRTCHALMRINHCLRTLDLDADVRVEMENARNALRARLASMDGPITRH